MSEDLDPTQGRQNPQWYPSGQCSLLATDIASSANRERTDDVLRRLRMVLYDLAEESFDGSRVPFDRCYWEDRGDGMIIIVPLDFHTSVLVSPLLDWIKHGLDRHNKLSSEIAQIKLRIALHIGDVCWDGRGLVGTAVNHVFRLLDAPALKAALSAPGTCLAFIASARVYEDVIRHGPGLVDPGDYRQEDVRVKETTATGWIRSLSSSTGTTGSATGTDVVARAQPGSPATTAAAGKPQAAIDLTPGTGAPQLPPAVAFDMVERFLSIRVIADTHGRDELVLALRKEIAAVIPRYPNARMDMWGILRTCLDFPAGLAELMTLVRKFAGDSLPVRDLEDEVGRLASDLRG